VTAARGRIGVSGALLATVLAVLLTGGCSASPAASYRPSGQACYDLAVQALQRHATLGARPPACAGLGPAQVNLAVARAIKDVTGPWPKAIARHLAYQDRAYLARLVSVIPPAPPAASPAGSQAPAPARASRDLPLDLAALAAWVLTAAAGVYLLAGWLVTWLARLVRRRRRRRGDAATAFTVSHFGLALTGLGVWIGFVATDLAVLAWVALGMVVLIAGLGMGVLSAALPGPARAGAGAGPGASRARIPVIVVAAHGMSATLTILLVLLAAIGAG
jgi:manganese efflux pump family protein